MKRSDFLIPSFSATEYLSALQNRHQTLEDLRTELRTRSQDLNKELLDLVNHNYRDFLGLGTSLRGGDEKVEEIRLGLLGFRREVAALKEKVGDRRKEIESLIAERRAVRQRIQLGRRLLELDQRIGELENKLLLTPKLQREDQNIKGGANEDDDLESESESEDDGDDEDTQVPMHKLRRRAEQFMLVKHLSDTLVLDQPFVAQQADRISRLRQTLLLDLNSALKEVSALNETQGAGQLFMLETYRLMGEPKEATKLLRESKSKKGA